MKLHAVFALVLLLAFAPAAARAKAKANPDFTPPRIIQSVEPRYPDELIQRGIYDGEVRLILLIDADGRLADWLLSSYTHPVLAREATHLLQEWRYVPARRDGHPIDTRLTLTMGFQASGFVVSISPTDLVERLSMQAPSRIVRVCQPEQLDGPVVPRKAVRPLWPAAWKDSGRSGSVVLDFYIDEQGRARMPVVAQADDIALALPAVEALSHWEFSPPMRNGEPVIVRARQAFRFTPRATPAATAGSE